MVGFFETLVRPDREELEMADRMVVSSAANLLQVGEFQLLQLAYREWHDADMPEAMIDRIFSAYMLKNEVPHWARHYARLILTRSDLGTLNDDDPAYHRYDHDYHTAVPRGVRHFCGAVAVLAFVLMTGILVAEYAVKEPISMLPPYFEKDEFRDPPRIAETEDGQRALGWGRAEETPDGADRR